MMKRLRILLAAAGVETIRTRYALDRILDLTENTFQRVPDGDTAGTPPAKLSATNV